MIISASGIVIDHYGDVLMIQRDDTRTLAPPGGAAKIGELPAQTVIREVKEETGLIVMPVRLVGLYHLPTKPENHLTFCYRCIMRGGEIVSSEESLRAGFFKTKPFPKPILEFHKERIQNSLAHQGGPLYWGTQAMLVRLRLGNMLLNHIIYPWLHIRRRQKGLPAYQPPPKWDTPVFTIISDEEKRVLWTKSRDKEEWVLPGDLSAPDEPPWETAVRSIKNAQDVNFHLARLSGVYPSENSARMTFTFVAQFNSGQPELVNDSESSFFAIGTEPPSARHQHVVWVKDALDVEKEIQVRLIPEEPNS